MLISLLLLGQLGPTEIYYDLRSLRPVSRPVLAKASETYLLRELRKNPVDVDLQAAARTRYVRSPSPRFYQAVMSLLNSAIRPPYNTDFQKRVGLHRAVWETFEQTPALLREGSRIPSITRKASTSFDLKTGEGLPNALTREEQYLVIGTSAYSSDTMNDLRRYARKLMAKYPDDPVFAAYGLAISQATSTAYRNGKKVPEISYSPDPAAAAWYRKILLKAPITPGIAYTLAISDYGPGRKASLQRYLADYPNDWPSRRFWAKFELNPAAYVDAPPPKRKP